MMYLLCIAIILFALFSNVFYEPYTNVTCYEEDNTISYHIKDVSKKSIRVDHGIYTFKDAKGAEYIFKVNKCVVDKK